MREHPWTACKHGTKVDHEKKALEQAEISVCSILRV